MDEQTVKKIEKALLESWSSETSLNYYEQVPSYGQCAQTAIVVKEKFGGEILKTHFETHPVSLMGKAPEANPPGLHFYNFIDGKRYDFTADQFELEHQELSEYEDLPSSKEEAESILVDGQLDAMRRAFNEALDK